MSQVQHSNNKAQYAVGRINEVIKTASVDVEGIWYTNGQAQVNFAIALFWGLNPDTGEENCVVINPETLKQLVNLPDQHILEGLRKRRKAKKEAPTELPDSLPGISALEESV